MVLVCRKFFQPFFPLVVFITEVTYWGLQYPNAVTVLKRPICTLSFSLWA